MKRGRKYTAAALFWGLSVVGAAAESFTCVDAENQTVSRVLGGQAAQLSQAPYQAVFKAAGGLCGGSFIGAGHVLTAAHCLYGGNGRAVEASEIKLQQGAVTLDSLDALRFAVRRVHIAPGYDPSRYDHDIAILELAQEAPVMFEDLATPATPGLERRLTRTGSCVQASGFGESVAGSGAATKRLQIVDMNLVDQAVCAGTLPSGQSLSSGMLCAGLPEGGKDTCRGDSGGALVVDTGGGVVPWLQVGVVSWGVGACGRAGYYGVYTRVSASMDWIEQVMEGRL